MLLGGLWHGAAWTYLLWGALHTVFLSLERFIPARVQLARALNELADGEVKSQVAKLIKAIAKTEGD